MSDGPDVDGPLPLPEPAAELVAGELRRLHRTGHSVGVTLPPSLLRLLGLHVGELVHVAMTPRGTVELVPLQLGDGPRDRPAELLKRLQHVEQKGRRLRRQLRARPLKVYNEGFNQGVHWALGEYFGRLAPLMRALDAGELVVLSASPLLGSPEPSPPATAPTEEDRPGPTRPRA